MMTHTSRVRLTSETARVIRTGISHAYPAESRGLSSVTSVLTSLPSRFLFSVSGGWKVLAC